MTIEQKLRDIRTERGLSQEALAELVNVSRQTVSKSPPIRPAIISPR